MTPSQLVNRLWEFQPMHTLDVELSAKQLMEISKAFNYFMAEEIQVAPCDHAGETHYTTMAGQFCGCCQRRMETNERRENIPA